MNVSAAIRRDQSFVLRPTDIATIWSVLTDVVGSVTARATCRDSIEREFQSAEQLTSYDNAISRAIWALNIRARSKDREISASLSFSGAIFSDRINLNIDGSEDQVIVIRDKLNVLFVDMKPWYAVVCGVDFFFVVWPLVVFTGMVIAAMTDISKSSRALGFTDAVRATSIAIVFFVGVGGLIWGLNRLREQFFPRAVFAIGRGADRYEFDEKIRWVVIIGFAVSVLASLLVAFMVPAA